VISAVLIERGSVKTSVDVWESLGTSPRYATDFSVAAGYYSDQIDLMNLAEYEHDVESLIRYIKATEKHGKADQMVSYIQYKIEGLNGVDIAGLLKVSNAMVNTIKNNLYSKMEEWKKQNSALK
jgi:hypothetical protein